MCFKRKFTEKEIENKKKFEEYEHKKNTKINRNVYIK